jgi:hypothetical protein
MKNRVGRAFASLLLGILMLGSTVHAQHNERIIKANIPFDFVVGSETFPAGRYSVALIGPVFLELRNSEGHTLTSVLTQSVQALTETARPKLRFDSEGGQHVLTQVWQEGDSTGQQILRSKSASVAVQKRSGHVQTAEVGNSR